MIGPRGAVAVWILIGIGLVAVLGHRPMHRTQEGRILETAREMLGQPWQKWMLPECNGNLRLRKPPLPYWMTAGSFKVFGVHDWAGRLPTALLGWLTIAVTYAIGQRLFGHRAGVLSAGALLGLFLFNRYLRLAETDVPAAFFVTLGIYAVWRASDSRGGGVYAWMHLAGAAMGFAVLSKGPPAAFIVLFLAALAANLGRWDLLTKFMLSGAVITAAAIALPWFMYVARLPEASVIGRELNRVRTGGTDHRNPFWYYLPMLLKSTAPMVGMVILALVAAGWRWKQDASVRGVLLWCISIFLPLSIVMQKQEHYLLPLMPALAVVAGWAIEQAIRGADARLTNAIKLVLLMAAGVGIACAIAAPIIGRWARKEINLTDFLTAVALAGAMVVVIVTCVRASLERAMVVAMLVTAPAIWWINDEWVPSLTPKAWTHPAIAADIAQRYGHKPLAFHGCEDLAICFYMSRTIRVIPSKSDLAGHEGTILITDRAPKTRAVRQLARYPLSKGLLAVYEVVGE